MSNLPTIVIPLISAEVNKELRYENPEQARNLLGDHFSYETNMFIGQIKVRDAVTMEIIPRARSFHVKEGWVEVASAVIRGVGTRQHRPIVAAIELTPPKPAPKTRML